MVQQSLEIRQGQSLVMTQQLRQSIELLQLSSHELQVLVENELEKNPVLTVNEESFNAESFNAESGDEKLGNEKNFNEKMRNEEISGATQAANADSLSFSDSPSLSIDKIDMNEGELWGGEEVSTLRYEGVYDGGAIGGALGSDFMQTMAERMVQKKTLHQELMTQLQNKMLGGLQLKMAEVIIDMIDASGYFPLDYQERASIMGINEADLENIIQLIHECEPTGVGARNLQECLQLQLQERELLDDVMQIILDNLPLIIETNGKKLCRLCRLKPEELLPYIAKIRECNPKPASDYEVVAPQTMIPDVMVRRGANGEWEVELNDEVLPKIAIDAKYSKQFVAKLRDKLDCKVVNEHMSNANWLLKSLQQRNATLLNVAGAIIAQQKDFFDFGIAYLHPMTLRDVAVAANCHESTVSRITTQKYMATERGTFEMKYFFTANLANANGGNNYSSRSVMHLIEQIIKREAEGKAFSDEAIAAELQSQGIEVARRTVVKYRKQLGIAPSNERKKQRK